MSEKIYKLYTDGGARGNPGPAAIGVVIKDASGEIVAKHGECIGETTNNQAEYKALIKGLEMLRELGAEKVDCFLDSELIVKQLKQEYKVKNKDLAPLFVLVWNLSKGFAGASFSHIPRAQNAEADQMVNDALDGRC